MRVLKRLLLPMLMSLSLLAAGCAGHPSKIGGLNLVSIDEEKQLGDKLAAEIAKKSPPVQDPEVQAFVNRVGKKLLAGARKVEFPYTFEVVKDDSINAFAIPGGHTYVNTGLIKAAASETEVAAVMAHEINHVVARHSTQQLTKQYGYQMVTGILLGNQGALTQMAADLFGQAGLLYYSRDMESQADYLGVETMYKAGYDPQGMVSFFQKLQAVNQQNPGKIAAFLSSHPQTGDRIKDIQAEIAKLPPKSYGAENDAEFEKVKAKVGRL